MACAVGGGKVHKGQHNKQETEMKGICVTLDGQLVCLFPFTTDTEFEDMAHNDLPSYALVYDDGRGQDEPMALEKTSADGNNCMFGWCFASCPVSAVEAQDYVMIAKADRDAIAELAIENDEWAAEQAKETDVAPVGDEQEEADVIIHVHGGMVAEVYGVGRSFDYRVVDFDIDDKEEREHAARRVMVSEVVVGKASPTGYIDDTIFRLCIDDIQTVAANYYGRELTDEELVRCRQEEQKLNPEWYEDVSAWLTMVVFPDGLK